MYIHKDIQHEYRQRKILMSKAINISQIRNGFCTDLYPGTHSSCARQRQIGVKTFEVCSC